jgi:uncharacterized RDD family membrane protein YckC
VALKVTPSIGGVGGVGGVAAVSAGSALDTDVAIETPEHIVFNYRIAGPARRTIAHIIDLIICYAALFAIGILLIIVGASFTSSDVTTAVKAAAGLFLLLLFVAQWLYFVICEARWGRSPGKKWLGLRVVTTSGRPIGWRAAALRNLLRAADLLPVGYLIGVVSMAVSSRFQRLGDLVAGTMVITTQTKSRKARAFELTPPAQPREIATLPEEVSLDVDERIAIELFLRRRNTLGVAREIELALMISGPIAKRIGFQHDDPSRLLALVYDRAVNAGRTEAPPSSWHPGPLSKRSKKTKKKEARV